MAHVLFISDEYPSYYCENGKTVRELAQGVASAGHQIGVIAPHINKLKSIKSIRLLRQLGRANNRMDEMLPVYSSEGLSFLPGKRIELFLFKRYLNFLLNKYIVFHGKPDVVHIHHKNLSLHAAKNLCNLYQLPFIISVYPDETTIELSLGRTEINPDITIVPHPVFLTNQLNNSTVLFSPVNLKYSYDPAWTISSKLIYLCGNNISDNLCSSLEIVMIRFPELQIVVDTPELKNTICSKFSWEKLAERITFFSETVEILYMANLVICLVPKFGDLIQLKQALIAGKPVLTYDNVWTRPLINKDNGRLFNLHEPESLAKGVAEITRNTGSFNFSLISQNALHLFGEIEVINLLLSKYRYVVNHQRTSVKVVQKSKL